jgi:hypothetical protein
MFLRGILVGGLILMSFLQTQKAGEEIANLKIVKLLMASA